MARRLTRSGAEAALAERPMHGLCISSANASQPPNPIQSRTVQCPRRPPRSSQPGRTTSRCEQGCGVASRERAPRRRPAADAREVQQHNARLGWAAAAAATLPPPPPAAAATCCRRCRPLCSRHILTRSLRLRWAASSGRRSGRPARRSRRTFPRAQRRSRPALPPAPAGRATRLSARRGARQRGTSARRSSAPRCCRCVHQGCRVGMTAPAAACRAACSGRAGAALCAGAHGA